MDQQQSVELKHLAKMFSLKERLLEEFLLLQHDQSCSRRACMLISLLSGLAQKVSDCRDKEKAAQKIGLHVEVVSSGGRKTLVVAVGKRKCSEIVHYICKFQIWPLLLQPIRVRIFGNLNCSGHIRDLMRNGPGLLSTFQALHPDLLSILQVSSGAR